MISQQDQTILAQFTLIAKKILYNKDRATSVGKIMESGQDGPTRAVNTVLASIEQMKPVPPAIKPMLAVNIFMIIADLTQEISGKEISSEVLIANIGEILSDIKKGDQSQQQPDAPIGMQPEMQQGAQQETAPQSGIIGRQLQGAVA